MTGSPVAAPPPTVTVGVPVYNGERFLRETLEALCGQTLTDLELLVADNASTDGTLAIAQEFARRDPRVRILTSEVNRGSTWNYNRLLKAASAPYFMWNSADDVISPEHLEVCRDILVEGPGVVIGFTRCVIINELSVQVGEHRDANIVLSSERPAKRLETVFSNQLWHAAYSGLYRTNDLRSVGGYGAFFGQDVALAAKMALRGPWVQAQVQSYRLRMHDHQMTKLQDADPVQQTRIFRPDHSGRFAFPHWYLTGRILREAVSCGRLVDRAAAVAVVAGSWIGPTWRSFAFDVKRNAIRAVRGRYVGAYHGELGDE